MKRIQSILLLAVCALCALPALAQKPFKMEGKLGEGVNHQKYYIYLADANLKYNPEVKDSVIVKKGKFTYTKKLDEARPMTIHLVGEDGKPANYKMELYAVPGETCVLEIGASEWFTDGTTFYKQFGAADRLYSESIESFNKKYVELNERVQKASEEERQAVGQKANEELRETSNNVSNTLNTYLKEHSNEEGAILYFMDRFGPESVLEEATDEVKNGRFSAFFKLVSEQEKARKEAEKKAEEAANAELAKTAEGKMFVDFEAEYNGKVSKLSDYVGKGKFVLVDFWASWCGPCKAEIPNLIEVYNKYKGDKFEVLGVATWDKPADTEKSIEQLKIPYPQIMNAQNAGSDAYGIKGIPQIILFGPDGTILKRNLRGEAIEKTVGEYLAD